MISKNRNVLVNLSINDSCLKGCNVFNEYYLWFGVSLELNMSVKLQV